MPGDARAPTSRASRAAAELAETSNGGRSRKKADCLPAIVSMGSQARGKAKARNGRFIGRAKFGNLRKLARGRRRGKKPLHKGKAPQPLDRTLFQGRGNRARLSSVPYTRHPQVKRRL
jgi:hypothetical protein